MATTEFIWTCVVWYDERRKRHFFNMNKIYFFSPIEIGRYVESVALDSIPTNWIAKLAVFASNKNEAIAQLFLGNIKMRIDYKDGEIVNKYVATIND